jgi:hypothetical protein
MALIYERKKGREDGGYSRVLGNDQLGALISQVQATTISAGTELEKMVSSHAIIMTSKQLGEFLSGVIQNGTYLLTKNLIKKHLKKIINSTVEPDFVVIIVVDEKVFVIELKDGDQFDTKKAEGEVEALNKFANQLHGHMLKEGLSNYTVEIKICFFNSKSKDSIVLGMKNRISKSQAMTGEEFCRLINISYSSIIKAREIHMEQNFSYFIEQLLLIPEVNEKIKKIIDVDQ